MKKITTAILLCIITMQLSMAQKTSLKHQWMQPFGGKGLDKASEMVIDGQNNLYITGIFPNECNFGTTKLVSEGGNDIFLAKYDAMGKLKFAKRLGGEANDKVSSIVIDSENNVYICGKYTGKNTIIGHKRFEAAGHNLNFVAKFNAEGEMLWAKHIACQTKGEKTLLAIDKEDNLYFGGTFYKSMQIGNKTLTSESASAIFVAQMNTEGKFLNAVSFDGRGNQKLNAMACDRKNTLYLAGDFEYDIAFGNSQMTSKGKKDGFLARLEMLDAKWATQIGGYYNDFATAVSVWYDKVAVGGSFADEALLGNTSLLSEGVLDAYVAAFDKEGQALWAQNIGGKSNEYLNSMVISHNGNIYLQGSFRGAIKKQSTEIESEEFSKDIFLAKFSKDGAFSWVENYGGKQADFAVRLLQGNKGYFYQINAFSGNLKLGRQKSVEKANQDDVFISKFYDCSEAPKAELGEDGDYCQGTTLKTEGKFTTYLWSNNSQENEIEIKNSGTFWLKTTDEHGCESSDTVEVYMNPAPNIDLGGDQTVPAEEPITLSVEGIFAEYLWSDGSTDETLKLQAIGESRKEYISLTVTDQNGCQDTDDVVIMRKSAEDRAADLLENGGNGQYRVYPNPTTGKFSVYSTTQAAIESIEIYDVAGMKVKSYEDVNAFPFEADLSSAAKGVYVVKVNGLDNSFEYRVVVE